MSEAFDPYYQWLAIPPEDQPPNLYRLLGVKDFERDLGVLSNAADRQMAHVRTFQNGPHSAASQQLLNELAKARITLLDAARKPTYDAMLQGAHQEQRAADIAPVATAEVLPGTSLSDYQLLKKLAVSNSGTVYKAKNKERGAVVSLKIMPPAATKSPELIKRFRREFDVSSRLSHPNLVAAYEYGEDRGMHFLTLEYVGGADLATVVKQRGPLPVEQAVEFTRLAAEGLQYLHEHGVYHRNVKPHNLLVNVHGAIKIANLTLAKLDEGAEQFMPGGEEALTRQGQMLGSVDYLAPEQAMDASKIDARADIYSLGCTLYHLLTGSPPYQGKSAMEKLVAHRKAPLPSVQAVRPDVPDALDEIVQKMMAKEPADRFASMAEVIDALELKEEPDSKVLSFLLPLVAVVALGLVIALYFLFR